MTNENETKQYLEARIVYRVEPQYVDMATVLASLRETGYAFVADLKVVELTEEAVTRER